LLPLITSTLHRPSETVNSSADELRLGPNVTVSGPNAALPSASWIVRRPLHPAFVGLRQATPWPHGVGRVVARDVSAVVAVEGIDGIVRVVTFRDRSPMR
jgi:hypothetical protein